MIEVTRVEIADYLESAFTGPPLSTSDLIEFAGDQGARNAVITVLARLRHSEGYRELRELWEELADVPVDS